MFTLNSDAKKILSKLFLLAGIFIIINIFFFTYLRDYTVAYRPLNRKAQVLFSLYPDPKIIIGGDSIAESAIDPLLLSPQEGINIATPASGIQGFHKAIIKYHSKPLTKDNVLIVNVSALSFNDEVISNEHFIGQADGFLNEGIPYLAIRWKKEFFKNIFNIYQCSFSSCPYLSDISYPGLENSQHHGFIPLVFPGGKQSTLSERKSQFANYEDYYKKVLLEGVLFKGFKKDLSLLAQTPAKIFIVFLPPMNAFKSWVDSQGPEKKLQNFIAHTKAECEQYPSCYFLDYYNWDQSKLPGNDEENYYDYIHFTSIGGKRFSAILKNDIELKLNGK